jgi:ribose transport system substrate-binding protein
MGIIMGDDRRRRRFGTNNGQLLIGLFALCTMFGCSSSKLGKVAVIPRTSGTMLWEPEHGGAEAAGRRNNLWIYWNAPTREDDTAAQIALVERITHGDYQGLVLAPDQALALMTPVRRAVAHGLCTVIVGSPLSIPASDGLSYIINDDEEGGRMAARRVALLLHGKGSVGIIGINPNISGIMIRARSFESYLAENYPEIQIAQKRMGSFNVPHEQQVAEEMLRSNENLDVIVALTWPSVRGAISTIESEPGKLSTKVIGFDPDALPFEAESLDSVIVQNTREMGYQAVGLIAARLRGQPMPPLVKLEPVLVTRENVNSKQVGNLTSMDWSKSP